MGYVILIVYTLTSCELLYIHIVVCISVCLTLGRPVGLFRPSIPVHSKSYHQVTLSVLNRMRLIREGSAALTQVKLFWLIPGCGVEEAQPTHCKFQLSFDTVVNTRYLTDPLDTTACRRSHLCSVATNSADSIPNKSLNVRYFCNSSRAKVLVVVRTSVQYLCYKCTTSTGH